MANRNANRSDHVDWLSRLTIAALAASIAALAGTASATSLAREGDWVATFTETATIDDFCVHPWGTNLKIIKHLTKTTFRQDLVWYTDPLCTDVDTSKGVNGRTQGLEWNLIYLGSWFTTESGTIANRIRLTAAGQSDLFWTIEVGEGTMWLGNNPFVDPDRTKPLHSTCTSYASPTGSPTGAGTFSDPSTIAAFTAAPAPGSRLCLMDGVYQGDDNMISFDDIHGTAAAPIAIGALEDGQVTIDGESARVPVAVKASSYIDLEGFDAKDSSGYVLMVGSKSNNGIDLDGDGIMDAIDGPSSFLNFRRIVASNAAPNFSDDDSDGVEGSLDNCSLDANPPVSTSDGLTHDASGSKLMQLDEDSDGFGNACDCDFVGPGGCDANDRFALMQDQCAYDFNSLIVDQYGTQSYCFNYFSFVPVLSGTGTDMNSDGAVDQADMDMFEARIAVNPTVGPNQATYGGNNHVIGVTQTTDTLFEDIAAFGTGRKQVQIYKSARITIRRIWARWEGNGGGNARTVSCTYRSYASTCENVIATNSGNQKLGPGHSAGILVGTDWMEPGDSDAYYAPVAPDVGDITQRGNLAYMDFDADRGLGQQALQCAIEDDFSPLKYYCPAKGLFAEGAVTEQLFADSAVYMKNMTDTDGAIAKMGVLKTVICPDGTKDADGTCNDDVVMNNLVGWGVSLPPVATTWPISASWATDPNDLSVDKVFVDADVSGPEIPLNRVFTKDASGFGGQLCYRANEPTVPLWPWPMQDRILTATTNQEMAPVPASMLWRRYGWVPQPVDLEARIEEMFGPIPPECKSQ